MLDRNSFFHVWQKVSDLSSSVPMPATICIEIPHDQLACLLEGAMPRSDYIWRIERAAQALGYPVFMRTDLASAKHDYAETCFVAEPHELMPHLARIVEFNEMAGLIGLNYNGVVLRRWLQLDAAFRAFRDMPVATEQRVFVRDGSITCEHFYWPVEAIERGYHSVTLPPDWKGRLALASMLDERERKIIRLNASLLAERLGGAWSLDFARGADGTWYFIDAATYEDSYHWPDCPNA